MLRKPVLVLYGSATGPEAQTIPSLTLFLITKSPVQPEATLPAGATEVPADFSVPLPSVAHDLGSCLSAD